MFDIQPSLEVGDTPPTAGACDYIWLMTFERERENSAAARTVHAAHGLWDVRMSEAFDADGDAATAWNEAVAEVAVVLSMPYRAARELVEVGFDLEHRLPAVNEVFSRGKLDYARVRTLCSVLRLASAETIAALEESALAAARHLSPGPLRNQLWRLWMQHNPEEAAAAKAENQRTSRTAYVRRGCDGLSWLSACITDLEGYEAERLIAEIAATVCANDPRKRNALRADGLMALLHGERILRCQCRDADCPTAGVAIPPRRTPLVQILVDIQTLLGLTNTPATLGDGTPLDPAVARMLAEDATWQAILTELKQLADGLGLADRSTANEGDHGSGCAEADFDPPEGSGPGFGEPDSRKPASPEPPTFSYAEYLGRGKKYPAGGVCQLPADHPLRAAPRSVGDVIDDIHDALANDDWFRRGVYPDGHGGYTTPPNGALTYRPGAALAALVRAMHPTCTFPGCTVSSKDCELDHLVPFDQENPVRGGWTIATNLQPLCKAHHQLKTKKRWTGVRLYGGAVRWTSRTGITRVTIPTSGTLIGQPHPPPKSRTKVSPPPPTDPLTAQEAIELLYEPTWWELNMGTTPGPSLVDVAKTPSLQHLRNHHQEHLAITAARDRLVPPPF